jgi:hypothetical protein
LFVACGFIIYLGYLIDNENLQDIVVTVFSSLFGGIITLAGVSWTIKDASNTRHEDEVKKAKPLFDFNLLRKEPALDNVVQRVCFPKKLEIEYENEVYSQIENSNKNSFILKSIYHDGEYFELEGNVNVLPQNKYILAFNFTDVKKGIYLVVEDELEKEHIYKLNVLYLGGTAMSGKKLYTIRGIEIAKNDIPEKSEKN